MSSQNGTMNAIPHFLTTGVPPRFLHIKKHSGLPFGMLLSGEAPVAVGHVDPQSIAEGAGLRPGDVILQIHNRDVVYYSQAQVIQTLSHFDTDPQGNLLNFENGITLLCVQMTTLQVKQIRLQLQTELEAKQQMETLLQGQVSIPSQSSNRQRTLPKRYSSSTLLSESFTTSSQPPSPHVPLLFD
eukprot:m.175741 g.175741  ORF g.175741 m.175741 type:complete len:185 (+) comp31828_c2_seq2:1056-1610(+)